MHKVQSVQLVVLLTDNLTSNSIGSYQFAWKFSFAWQVLHTRASHQNMYLWKYPLLWCLGVGFRDPKRISYLIIPMHWFLSICVKMFFCLTSVATPLLWLLWVCAAAKFANINLFYVWEEKLYFTLCKSNGPPCPYVCNGPGRRFPQKIWKTHFLCLPSNIICQGGIASSALKGRRSILNLDVRTNLEANLNAYCCGK